MSRSNPLENAHLSVVDAASDPPKPQQRLGLAPIDQLALKTLVSDDPAAAIEHARGLAEALVGADRDGARLRTLSRAIALCETERALLDAMLMERLAKRDSDGVEVIDRVLRGLTARTTRLIEAHRLESMGQQRAVAVGISHADQVTVCGVGEK